MVQESIQRLEESFQGATKKSSYVTSIVASCKNKIITTKWMMKISEKKKTIAVKRGISK